MGIKDDRAVSVDKGKTNAGWRQVRYRDAKGYSHNARVLGQGSASGLKLHIDGGSGPAGTVGSRVVDNVPMATTMKSINCYFSRQSNV
jgi:hypothetical protein